MNNGGEEVGAKVVGGEGVVNDGVVCVGGGGGVVCICGGVGLRTGVKERVEVLVRGVHVFFIDCKCWYVLRACVR